MAALANGDAFGNVSFNVTVTFASIVVVKATQLITSSAVRQVAQMMSGICRLYALHAIQAKGGGFLVAHGHP